MPSSSFPTEKLLQWFSSEARDLPWRENYEPYQVLISEMMLQQTQIATALPYFHRWVKRWPDWSSLAAASEEEVLGQWEGLGYYQRARRLLALARTLSEDHGGSLPTEPESLAQLPGLGPYTVAAVHSIAFNGASFPIDGNVRRVLSRFLADSTLSPSPKQDEHFSALMLPEFQRIRRRRELAQAMMELGATICRPKNPDCEHCPLSKACACSDAQKALGFPVKKSKAAPKPKAIVYLWVWHEGRVWLRQRPPKGRFPAQWEPPTLEGPKAEALVAQWAEAFPNIEWDEPQRRDFTTFHVWWTAGIVASSEQIEGFQAFPAEEVGAMNLVPLMKKNWSSFAWPRLES